MKSNKGGNSENPDARTRGDDVRSKRTKSAGRKTGGKSQADAHDDDIDLKIQGSDSKK